MDYGLASRDKTARPVAQGPQMMFVKRRRLTVTMDRVAVISLVVALTRISRARVAAPLPDTPRCLSSRAMAMVVAVVALALARMKWSQVQRLSPFCFPDATPELRVTRREDKVTRHRVPMRATAMAVEMGKALHELSPVLVVLASQQVRWMAIARP